MSNKINLKHLANYFSDEDAARNLFEHMRWPNGVICPHCKFEGAYKLTAKEGSKSPVREGVYKCKACRKQFSAKVGTIFEHSHIPLSTWLHAIHLMYSSKKGMSAYQLHRILGITYKSTYFMALRIRNAMAQEPMASKLSGIVEVDETYVGSKAKNMHASVHRAKIPGRATVGKAPVVTLAKRNGHPRTDRPPGKHERAATKNR